MNVCIPGRRNPYHCHLMLARNAFLVHSGGWNPKKQAEAVRNVIVDYGLFFAASGTPNPNPETPLKVFHQVHSLAGWRRNGLVFPSVSRAPKNLGDACH